MKTRRGQSVVKTAANLQSPETYIREDMYKLMDGMMALKSTLAGDGVVKKDKKAMKLLREAERQIDNFWAHMGDNYNWD